MTFLKLVLLKIFDAEFPYKLSYFEPLCLPARMAAETVIRSILNKTYVVNQGLISPNRALNNRALDIY